MAADPVLTIRQACDRISTYWDDLLEPPGRSGAAGKRAHTRLWTLEDDDKRDNDVDWLHRMINLRARTLIALNGWCRVVMEDRNITNPKSLPLGDDVHGMCAFVDRHADWIVNDSDPAEGIAEAVAEELGDYADQIERVAAPKARNWHYLGRCPFLYPQVPDLEPEDTYEPAPPDADAATRLAYTLMPYGACEGRVRVRIGADDDEAVCSDCDQRGPIAWWEVVLGVTPKLQVVDVRTMTKVLADRLHVVVSESQLRRWASQGRVRTHVPFGPLPDPSKPSRIWFNVREVLDDVATADRECPTCGHTYSGAGLTCARCYGVARSGPRFVDNAPEPYPVRVVSVAPDPPQPAYPSCAIALRPGYVAQRERCSFTDLPTKWCACATHRHQHLREDPAS